MGWVEMGGGGVLLLLVVVGWGSIQLDVWMYLLGVGAEMVVGSLMKWMISYWLTCWS